MRLTLPTEGVTAALGWAVVALGLAVVAGLVWLWPSGEPVGDSGSLGPPVQLIDATVESVEAVTCPGPGAGQAGCAAAGVRLEEGPEAGELVVLDLIRGPGQPDLGVGDAIVVGRSDEGGGVDYYFSDFQRGAPLLILGLVFAAVVVAVGRFRGLAALAGVAASVWLLVVFLLPALLEGKSPLLVSIVGAAAMMFLILYLAHGISAMTTSALVGTLVSLSITGVLASLFVEGASIVSGGSEEATLLQFSGVSLNLQGLLLGGIIIGSLGVLNDVTITQASAVWQLRAANPALGVGGLYRSAMRIGRDHIASAVDTLVLAYAGASLPLLLLFSLADRPVAEILTGELVATEIVRTLVGSIGLAASVPITTALAALVVTRQVAGRGARRDGTGLS